MFSYKAQEELELMGFAKLECSNAGLRPEEKIELLDLDKYRMLSFNIDAYNL
jgi:hypothetical protein